MKSASFTEGGGEADKPARTWYSPRFQAFRDKSNNAHACNNREYCSWKHRTIRGTIITLLADAVPDSIEFPRSYVNGDVYYGAEWKTFSLYRRSRRDCRETCYSGQGNGRFLERFFENPVDAVSTDLECLGRGIERNLSDDSFKRIVS